MRHRVDWDKEIEKTEKIRRRGIFMSILSLAMACAFIFGITRFSGINLEIPKSILFAGILFVSLMVLRVIIRNRLRKREQNKFE